MTKKVLCGLIMLTAAIFSAMYLIAQAYLIAALSFILGLIWLILEMTENGAPASVFFLFYLALAIIGTLNNISVATALVGLSTDLAAWDLSRFRARITNGMEWKTESLLETRHLQILAAAIGSGLIIGLSFSLIRISISFAVLASITLLVMVAFRKSILNLRGQDIP
jgi:hypothetical protein